jgi:hypothetical protein
MFVQFKENTFRWLDINTLMCCQCVTQEEQIRRVEESIQICRDAEPVKLVQAVPI